MSLGLGMHTLHVEHAFLMAVYSLITLVNSRMHKGIRGIYWFSFYNLLAFLGALLIAFRNQAPDLLSIVLANLFVVAGYICLFISIARFYGARFPSLWLQGTLFLAAVFGMVQYGFLHPDTTLRLIVYSTILGLLQGHTAWYTLRKNTSGADAAKAMAVILAGLSLMNLLRISSLLSQGAPKDDLQVGGRLAWFVLFNTALQCGVTVSYVWMTASFVRDDLALQATTDALTGLLNRRALDAAAERILSFARPGDTTAVITIDLDRFKEINDTYGHHCGDAVLTAVARTLQRGMRQGDFLGRMGGDEFVAVLPRTSVATACLIADRLRVLISSIELPYGEARIKTSASFGAAGAIGVGQRWDHVLLACDQRLYAQKRGVQPGAAFSDQPSASASATASSLDDFAGSLTQE